MEKTSKKASLKPKKTVPEQPKVSESANLETLTQETAQNKGAKDVPKKEPQAAPGDVGGAAGAASPSSLKTATNVAPETTISSPTSPEATNTTAAPAKEAPSSEAATSSATPATENAAPAKPAASSGGYSTLTYVLAAVGVGAVAAAAGGGKSGGGSSAPATAGVTVTGTAAELAPGGSKYASITNGVNVTVTTPATLAQLAAIDAANGSGVLTYTAVIDSVANLSANAGGYVKAGVSVTAADTLANLIDASGAVSPYVKTGVNVLVTNSVNISQLAVIDTANGSGVVTAAVVTDTLANLISNAGGYAKAGVSLNVTDNVSIAQLNALKSTATDIAAASITDSASAIVPGGVVSQYVTKGTNVTLTDAASVAQLTSIQKASGTGALNYKAVVDTAANIVPNGGAVSYIQSGKDVTVTDGASIHQLKLISASIGDGVLTYNAVTDTLTNLANDAGEYVKAGKSVTVFDTAANLVSNTLTPVYSISNIPVLVDEKTDTAATIAQLTTIDKANGAAPVTYSMIADTRAELLANLGGYVKNGINLQVADPGSQLSVGQLSALDGMNGSGTVMVTAGAIVDTAANLAPGGVASIYVTSGGVVSVTDAASIAQLSVIRSANGAGTLNYAAIQDTIANLTAPGAGAYLATGNNLKITVSDTANIAQLTALESTPGVLVVPTSISDTAANLSPNGVASYHINSGMPVTVVGPISIAELAAIDAANGSASVTYTALTDTLANLNANALLATNAGGYIANGINLVVTDTSTITELAALDAKNGAGTVSGSNITDVVTSIVQNGVASSYIKPGAVVTIDEAAGPIANIGQLTAIRAANGAGELNYTAITDTAVNLATVSGVASSFITAGKNVTIDDVTAPAAHIAPAANIAQLAAIDAAKGSGVMRFAAVQDSAANLAAPAASPYLTGGINVSVTDVVSVAQLTAIENSTGRQPNLVGVSDTAANLVPAGTPDSHIAPGIVVTVTDPISMADLAAIDAANGAASVNYSAIADTLANLTAATAGAYVKSGINLHVQDVGTGVSIAQLAALRSVSGAGLITAASVTDTAANLLPNGVAASYIAAGTAVEVTGVANIAQLTAIHNANGAGSLRYSALSDSIANLEPNGVASSFVAPDTAVTVTDTANIAQLTTLNSATQTTHAVATSISDTVANLAPGGVVSNFISTGAAVNVDVTDAIPYNNLASIVATNGGGAVTYHSVVLDASTFGGGIALNPGAGANDAIQLSVNYPALDLSQFNGAGQPVIQHFEKLDMKTDIGANTVTLTASDLFNLNSDLTDATVSNSLGAAHVLVIDGNAADAASVLAGGFAQQGATNGFTAAGSAGSGYSKYVATYTDAVGAHLVEVLLQNGVAAV